MLKTVFSILFSLSLAFPAGLSLAASADVPPGVQITLDRYFAALRAGDTNDLSTLYTGDLKSNRAELSNDNEHANHLKNRHENAVITVLSQQKMNDTYYSVHYRVEHNNEVLEKMVYLMESATGEGGLEYQIVREVLVP